MSNSALKCSNSNVIYISLNVTSISIWFVFGSEGPDDVVGPEGMEKFCEDIGVEPENVGFFHNTNHTFTGLDLVLYTALHFSKQRVAYLVWMLGVFFIEV